MSLLDEAAARVDNKADLDEVAAALGADPVYRSVAGGAWRPPVADCRQASRLRAAAAGLRNAVGTRRKSFPAFFEATERLPACFRDEWESDSYFIVPVVDAAGVPGMVPA